MAHVFLLVLSCLGTDTEGSSGDYPSVRPSLPFVQDFKGDIQKPRGRDQTVHSRGGVGNTALSCHQCHQGGRDDGDTVFGEDVETAKREEELKVDFVGIVEAIERLIERLEWDVSLERRVSRMTVIDLRHLVHEPKPLWNDLVEEVGQ